MSRSKRSSQRRGSFLFWLDNSIFVCVNTGTKRSLEEQMTATDPKTELRNRLLRLDPRVRNIHIMWGREDGGPRMDVVFTGHDVHDIVVEWNDWMILGNAGGPNGVEIICGIMKDVLGRRAELKARGNTDLHFTIR